MYSGTRTRKPSTAYSRVDESVGLVVGTPVIDVSPPNASSVRLVHVRCAVDWNTTAHPDGFDLSFFSTIDGGRYDSCDFGRLLNEPGTVEYWYAVTGDEVGDLSEAPYLAVTANVTVDSATIGLPEPAYAEVTITQ